MQCSEGSAYNERYENDLYLRIDAANPEPLPASLVRFELIMQARTVGEVADVVRAHEASGCPICAAMNAIVRPMPAQRETRTKVPRLVA